MRAPRPLSSSASSPAFALVIVLSFVVLLTVVMLALFAKAQFNLLSERSATNNLQADLLSQSALDLIVADLRSEMLAGSDFGAQSDGYLILRPATNNSAIPSRIVASSVASSTNFVNLVKQSLRATPTYSNAPAAAYPSSSTYPGIQRASGVSTAEASRNGRSVLPARWNAPQLTLGAGFNTTNQSPDWILISRAGVKNQAAWNSNLTKSASSNPDFVIGRYAYHIYDIGGLLDVNAAGFPGSAAAPSLSGTLAGVDLSHLPGGPPASGFFAWRNPGSGSYSNFVLQTGLPGGYLSNSADNRLVTGRRDLIKLAQSQGFTNALPYLTHFTREKNMPAWGPSANASTLGGTNGTAYAYRDQANQPAAVNRFFPQVRFSHSGTIKDYTDDGSLHTVQVASGQSLVQRRFSLTRLSWIGRNGPQNGGTPEAIRSCFGLLWSGESWLYVGSDNESSSTPLDRIKTLDQIAQEATPRLPNFFELLQAGILDGSLGLDNKGYSGLGGNSMPYLFQKEKFLHLLTLGANIIDQYDSDSFPTIIVGKYASADVRIAGSESLPYLNYYKDVASTSPTDPTAWASYILVSLWNPYTAVNASPAGETPRLRVNIQGYFQQECGWSPTAPTAAPFLVRTGTISGTTEISSASLSTFTTSTILTSSLAAASGTWQELPVISGVRYLGYRLPDVVISPSRAPIVNSLTGDAYTRARYLVTQLGSPSDPFVCTVEFYDANSGRWIPYSYSTGIDDITTWRQGTLHYTGGGTTTTGVPSAFSTGALRSGAFRFKVDPRSTRFNEHQFDNATATDSFTSPLTSMPSGNMQLTPSLFGSNWKSIWTPYALSRNSSGATSESYTDSDGIQRIADSGLSTAAYPQDTPYTTASHRPRILNRPFRSVAELGYAFRDLPWKSLDFFTAKSGDSALLDLFSLTDAPAVRAGVLNLNTRNTAVLETVLGSSTLASALSAYITATPLLSRADLAAAAATAFSSAGLTKVSREAPLAVLAEAGQTRTWNLLIDVIVQSGQYPPNASGLADFTVDGEKRFWLSIAIDRYTGEIVDQTLEAVYEY